MTSSHLLVIISWIAAWILATIPVFVIGIRRRVVRAGVAFIPIIGPTIVLLQSIRRSGWLCLLGLFPLTAIFFYLWLICVLPGRHGRTRWWIPALLIPLVNLFGYYAYAFTLDSSGSQGGPKRQRGGFASTYHVPPGYKQRGR
jgi:hypothetical protein